MTTERHSAEYVEVLSHPTTKERHSAEYVEVLSHPTTQVRTSAVYVEVLVGPNRFFPLRLFPRNDDLDGPRLPQFADSASRSTRLGSGSYD